MNRQDLIIVLLVAVLALQLGALVVVAIVARTLTLRRSTGGKGLPPAPRRPVDRTTPPPRPRPAPVMPPDDDEDDDDATPPPRKRL